MLSQWIWMNKHTVLQYNYYQQYCNDDENVIHRSELTQTACQSYSVQFNLICNRQNNPTLSSLVKQIRQKQKRTCITLITHTYKGEIDRKSLKRIV